MGDWLAIDGSLVGLTEGQVEARLGRVLPETKFSEWDLVYALGPERGLFSIDYEWLVIRLGTDGKVIAAVIARD
jgi:hypothetical protein